MVNKHVTQWFLRFTLLALWFAGGVARGQTPGVSSFTPASGAPGTSVILSGANFLGATQVRFNTVDAIFEVLSSSQIAVTVPVDALTGLISVATPGGTRSSSSSFVVTPRITGFSPTIGLAGTTVIISGANFINGATTVQFNGVTANAPVVTADSQISATVPVGATNGFITVTTLAGTATSADTFIVSNAPRITEFSPTIARYGDRVTISGLYFVAGTTVKFHGTNAPGVSYTGQNGTQIQVNVPTGATTGPITVTTANGTFTTSTNFVTGAGPIITGFSPIAGVPGTSVTISGINFSSAFSVQFNNVFITKGNIAADTQINATVPSGATTGPIKISSPIGTGISTNNFHAGPDPIITDFFPTNGPVGTSVSISGANLGGSTVKFNGVAVSSVVVAGQNGTQVQVFVPAGATTGLITAANAAGTNSSATPFAVTGPGPFINSFSPGSGPAGGEVIIEGANFVAFGTSVSFNGIASGTVIVTATTQLKATVPVGATTGPISVTTLSGTGTSTNKFFVWPRITGFTPATGTAGASVSITGANFTNATAVQFNGAAASFTVNSSTNLTATVPADATTGTLSVTTPAGIVASTTNFFVPPKIDSFTPAAGAVGVNVLISGSAFFGTTTVKFNGTAANIFTIISRRQIVAVVPTQATSGKITVTTSDGTATSASDFKILPTINGFSPTSGGAGAMVVITGTSFAGVTGVYFNGESAAFTTNSPSQITATIPYFATPGRIAVATADGTSTSATDFQVLPILYIGALAGQDVLIGWPVWATNFTLEATTNLVPVVVWTTVTNTPGVQGGENLITNNAASGKKFYRMKKQ